MIKVSFLDARESIVSELEKWEFGCLRWCEFASGLGIKLITRANVDLHNCEWGFSEKYTHTPERLMDGRKLAGYHLMIKDGKISGGPFIPQNCLDLPGFHAVVDWALIAHSSYLPFNTIGNQERGTAQVKLRRELKEIGIGDGKWSLESGLKTDKKPPRCRACGSEEHDRVDCPVWPPGIGEALGNNPDHRWRLKRSPELEGFPETEWGVPIFSDMDEAQKTAFKKLLGH